MPAATPAGGYQSLQDELIAHAPIRVGNAGNTAYTADYLADRSKVWELISDLTRDQDCWSYIQPAQRTRDGGLAFLGLNNRYLVDNNVDNMSSNAEAKLKGTSYYREKRWWNFEKYAKMHVDQHVILTVLVEHGYSGIDDRSKVRHLMAGIKTKVLDPVKTQIMARAALRNDFDICVNLYKDFNEQSDDLGVRDANISLVQSDKNGASSGSGSARVSGTNYDKVVPDNSVPDRYYTGEEYQALNDAQKKGLKLKRAKIGHKPKVKHGHPSGGGGGNK